MSAGTNQNPRAQDRGGPRIPELTRETNHQRFRLDRDVLGRLRLLGGRRVALGDRAARQGQRRHKDCKRRANGFHG